VFFIKTSACYSVKKSFPIVRYLNGIVFLKCAHYSTDFGTRMILPGEAKVQKKSFPKLRYFHRLLVFTKVFLKYSHFSTDFGTQM